MEKNIKVCRKNYTQRNVETVDNWKKPLWKTLWKL